MSLGERARTEVRRKVVTRDQSIPVEKLLGRNAVMFCECELISWLFWLVICMDWDFRVWELAKSSDSRCVCPPHRSVAWVQTALYSWPVCAMLLTSGDTVLRPRHAAVQRLTPHFVLASSGFVSRLGPWLVRPTVQTSDQVESYNGRRYASF
jgi:hypothetical protein